MKHKIAILTMAVALMGFAFSDAYAEERGVVIVEGNIDPTCIESQCYDPTVITVAVGDTVVWENQDVPAHTIVSGSPFEGQDGAFDSGLILPNKDWKLTFVTAGDFPYYCVLHPWATGTVRVTAETVDVIDEETGEVIGTETTAPKTEDLPEEKRKVQSLGFIGQKVGDGRDYMMTYVSQGSIVSSFVNMEENYILFTFSTPAPAGDEILLKLHGEMIQNPNFVEANGVPLTEYNYVKQDQFNVLQLKTPVETWEIKVYGSQVVPEFGAIAWVILAVSIIGIIAVTKKTNLIPSLNT